MINAFIVHGKPTKERYENPDTPKPHQANWLPWLGSELDKVGVSTVIPEMPKPYFAEYGLWKSVFSTLVVNEKTTLIGHRVGQIIILSSMDDNLFIQVNARRLAAALPQAELIELDGYGHFMLGNKMESPEFPKLLGIIKSEP